MKLAEQELEPGSFEILIANNNPEEAPPQSLSLPPNARVVWQPKPGSYAARNAAAKQATGEILCFTDSDCLPRGDWLRNAMAQMRSDPPPARIGGEISLFPAGSNWTVFEDYDRIRGIDQKSYIPKGYAATANLIVRASVFREVGPFNESLFSGGDKEWNKRATQMGHSLVFGADVVVDHPARASFEQLKQKRLRVAGGEFLSRRKPTLPMALTGWTYQLPSLSFLARVIRRGGFGVARCWQLWMLDYRLRRLIPSERRALRRGQTAKRL